MHLKTFAAHPQHVYLVRLVDPPRAPLPLPDAEVIVARGPFGRAADRTMLTNFRAEFVVAKNAGGEAASAKIEAARDLSLPVVMVRRPFVPARDSIESVEDVMRWLGHDETPTERGV
jgi:precorrin-6A/cobalt-precorrin-6A reductase